VRTEEKVGCGLAVLIMLAKLVGGLAVVVIAIHFIRKWW
jgi:hypothetical protein